MTHRLTRYEAEAVIDTLSVNLSELAQKTFVHCRVRGDFQL